MVRERSRCIRCRGGFILDGFPRSLSPALALRELMVAEKLPLSAVVNYELPIAEIVERLSGRRTCEQCKAIYHVAPATAPVGGCVRPLWWTSLSVRRRSAGLGHSSHGSLRTQYRSADRLLSGS